MKCFALPLAFLLLSFSPIKIEKKVIYYPSGNKHFEYEVKSDLLNGLFTSYYENGKIKLQGELQNNQKTGLWTAYDEKGTKRSQRKFIDDYSFEIINEWDAAGNAIDPQILNKKNERIIGARSKGVSQKQSRYTQRFWKDIAPGKLSNQFLFENNTFYNFLITQALKKTMYVFSDDRCINNITDYELLKSYKDATVTSFLLKEDLVFTVDHEVMHTKLIAICPVVTVNGETKQVGWFYIPNARENREATDGIEEIITKLEKHSYTGTVTKTTLNAKGQEYRTVSPGESDFCQLSPIEWEGQAWIYFLDQTK
jgi:hypothetical protein